MAKHPVPKRRASPERSRRRQSMNEMKTLKKLAKMSETVTCPACSAPRQSHTACPSCGEYRGRKVIDTAKKAPKIEKVQA